MSSEQTRTIEAPRREPAGRLTVESRRAFDCCAYSWTKAVLSIDHRLSLHGMYEQTISEYERWWTVWKL